MRILITAGPTHEPIDEVRYISNRSSGQMGAALIAAALKHHTVTAILGPTAVTISPAADRIDVETAAQMQQAVMAHFPRHDALIMAAAVADYRPKETQPGKIDRGASIALELVPTADIIATASQSKRPDQRTIAFGLESAGNIDRARQKMLRKGIDLMVYNSTSTMESQTIEPTLLYPDGRTEQLPCRSKADFADILMERVVALF